MWRKKNKEKEEKTVVTSTKTHYFTQTTETSQTLSVTRTENRSRSVSVGGFPMSTPSSSLSSLDHRNMLTLPLGTPAKTSSASNLNSISKDAKPVNLNYQSPYRNSPVYSSFQYKSRPSAVSSSTVSPYKPPPAPSTGTQFRSALPATIVSLPNSANKKIQVKKTGKFYDSSSLSRVLVPTYDTHSKNRGEVLIINNIMFKDKGERKGAKIDHENLQTLFKQMGFKVTVESDLRKSGIISKVKNFSKKSSLKSCDIAITVVMSHGTKNTTLGGTEVFGLDEEGVLVDELIEFFNETDCKYMSNKPKIFIFQCCRGDNEQFIESDAVCVPSKKPALSNALIAYSTLPGYVSHRSPETGTWYIQTLCDIFSEHAHEHHVEDLLRMVDEKLSRIHPSIKQTTTFENRGFKRCYLHPV